MVEWPQLAANHTLDDLDSTSLKHAWIEVPQISLRRLCAYQWIDAHAGGIWHQSFWHVGCSIHCFEPPHTHFSKVRGLRFDSFCFEDVPVPIKDTPRNRQKPTDSNRDHRSYTAFCDGIKISSRPQCFGECAQASIAQPTLRYKMLDYQYHGHDINELPCLPIQAVFELICGHIEANIQGIKTDIQFEHVPTRHACVVSFWPITFLNTAISLRISF